MYTSRYVPDDVGLFHRRPSASVLVPGGDETPFGFPPEHVVFESVLHLVIEKTVQKGNGETLKKHGPNHSANVVSHLLFQNIKYPPALSHLMY